ncbi:MAG: hypothetical protein P8Z78_14270 [Gammaproteobacteria bacterium]
MIQIERVTTLVHMGGPVRFSQIFSLQQRMHNQLIKEASPGFILHVLPASFSG